MTTQAEIEQAIKKAMAPVVARVNAAENENKSLREQLTTGIGNVTASPSSNAMPTAAELAPFAEARMRTASLAEVAAVDAASKGKSMTEYCKRLDRQ